MTSDIEDLSNEQYEQPPHIPQIALDINPTAPPIETTTTDSTIIIDNLGTIIIGRHYFDGKSTEYIVDSFAPVNRIVLFNGREGSGKSKFALAMAHAVCAGIDFVGQHTIQGRVLWFNVDRQVPADIEARCIELGHDDDEWVDEMIWHGGDDLDLMIDGMTDRIIELANQFEVKLIVFDTLASMFSASNLDENSAMDAEKLMQRIIKIARNTSACVYVLHHMPKNSENRSGRGSGAIAAKVDIELLFTPDSNMLGTVTIEVKKSRTHSVGIFPFRIDHTGFVPTKHDNAVDEPQGAWLGLIGNAKSKLEDISQHIKWFLSIITMGEQTGTNTYEMTHEAMMKYASPQEPSYRRSAYISSVVDFLKKEGVVAVKKGNNKKPRWIYIAQFTQEDFTRYTGKDWMKEGEKESEEE